MLPVACLSHVLGTGQCLISYLFAFFFLSLFLLIQCHRAYIQLLLVWYAAVVVQCGHGPCLVQLSTHIVMFEIFLQHVAKIYTTTGSKSNLSLCVTLHSHHLVQRINVEEKKIKIVRFGRLSVWIQSIASCRWTSSCAKNILGYASEPSIVAQNLGTKVSNERGAPQLTTKLRWKSAQFVASALYRKLERNQATIFLHEVQCCGKSISRVIVQASHFNLRE